MKKTYSKPRVYIQDMRINSFVAGACSDMGVPTVNYDIDTCYYTDPESHMTFYSAQCEDETGWGVDIVNPNKSSPYAQLCYHRPLDVLNFFSS